MGGFPRDRLKPRYDVSSTKEDEWHDHSDQQTRSFVASILPESSSTWRMLLNAGAGTHDVDAPGYVQVPLDLFPAPIAKRHLAVCGNIEQMPFRDGGFDIVVCVGEVLSYCDPVRAIAEFSRVLRPDGILILDFGSTTSPRHWFNRRFGRAADLFNDFYNGATEPVWIYRPSYIEALLTQSRFTVRSQFAVHVLSALARRAGLAPHGALRAQSRLRLFRRWSRLADVVAIAAVKDRSW